MKNCIAPTCIPAIPFLQSLLKCIFHQLAFPTHTAIPKNMFFLSFLFFAAAADAVEVKQWRRKKSHKKFTFFVP